MILYKILKDHSIIIVNFLMVLFFNQTSHMHNCPSYPPSNSHATQNTSSVGALNQNFPLKMLNLEGYFEFNDIHHAASDFGNIYHFLPTAILYPASVSDISTTVQHVFKMGATSELTIAARGHGHSLHGQSQTKNGIIVSMESLRRPKMHVHVGEQPYVDVSGGELWINVLHETLNFGLAPKSWTDYLYLTVGGTLSNAGVSGQAFRHGPQIENVRQLEVVTGKGDVVTCSEELNADLFYGALGGLGQFGIITRAKISLEPAPEMVKWIRVLYSDFHSFTKDQEYLISLENSFDYIEGFVIINRTGLLNNWRSSFNPKDPLRAHQFYSEGKTLYCLEMAKYFNPEDYDAMNEATENLLSRLHYIQQTHFSSEVSYVDFLNRVHLSEQKLREKSLWDVPHPWLNLFIPRSRIHDFAEEVFSNILTDTSNGPILIYPVNQSRWSHRNSMVTPEEDVFYLVAFLSSAVPSLTGSHSLQHLLTINKRIKKFCDSAQPKVKEYLAHYNTQKEWRAHFGQKWETFAQRKSRYDPLGILAPGQGIFQRRV